ncbi:MAG TPA: 2OG-Fe(II) oxygenase, partial [Candidatus Acidoferrum sp.]|nr:2OG-Fe(II) oxygenase [Candidatus Acidoferrum sp.]
QLVVMLGQQGCDWDGGEFVLVENVPRAQSRAEVITADQGHGIIFTTRYRPVKGARGTYRVSLRHGVSRIRSGTRYTLGIIYHDAK